MLVCNVSQLHRRAAIAVAVTEAASALDAPGTGNVVLATLVDDPAAVRDRVDAYLGEIMVEAASATASENAGLVYALAVVEAALAVDAWSGVVPTAISAAVTEAVSAADAPDATVTNVANYATFDLATVANTALSNGNLTATHTTATGSSGARVASANGKSSGKYYFEIKVLLGRGANDKMGLAKPAASYADMTLGNTNTILAVFRPAGNAFFVNGASSGKNLGGFASNDVLCVAVDLTAGLVWCRKNAGNWNADAAADPATATGGAPFTSGSCAPYAGFGGVSTAINDAYTANFGASAFSGAVPSGFTAGWII